MNKTENKKPYQLFIGSITGTGWPIDGHRLVLGKWDYSPLTYSLMDWDEKDDAALMLTIFQAEVEAGFEDPNNLEAFEETWNAGKYEWPAAFHFAADQVCNIEQIEKSPFGLKPPKEG